MPTKSQKSKKKIIQSLHHVPSLRETVLRMSADGKLSKERENYINLHLEEWVGDSKYILMNLGVHLGIGFVRFTAIPFPFLGSVLRVLWVIANRIYCDLKWDMHRKKVHSLLVLGFSAIPFLGYFAYTIPLKKKSEYLTYLYAEHVSYMMYDRTFEDKLKRAPGFIKKISHALLVPKNG